MPTDAFHQFHAFSATHAAVLGAFAAVTALACVLGRRSRKTRKLRRAECVAGGLMLALWAASTTYWLLPAHYRIDEALPLHMCDLTGLIAPLVLITRLRWLRTLLYFWGLGLSIHGILTPVLEHGPAYLVFWLFWLTHTSIIGTAVYDLVARRYRPTWRDCAFAILACAAWLGVVLAVNLQFGTNYGYVGNVTPARPTVIDRLGPWPLRVFKISIAVIALFVAMKLPFKKSKSKK